MPKAKPKMQTVLVEVKSARDGLIKLVAFSKDDDVGAVNDSVSSGVDLDVAALRLVRRYVQSYGVRGTWYFADDDESKFVFIKADAGSGALKV